MLFAGRKRLAKCLTYYITQEPRYSVNFKTKDYSGREAKFMKKLLISKPSKKAYFKDEKPQKSIQMVINDPSSQRRTPMRVSVLNKLFMTSITDMLATGELSEELIGRGMEVTNISVSKDYQTVKVYWIAKSSEDEAWLQNNLPKLSHSLRHDLSQLHLMGTVPYILFAYDKRRSQFASIDSLISSCDKGSTDIIDETEQPTVHDDIPIMTNNTYRLQYDVITSKITKSINKAKAPHRLNELNSNNQIPSQVTEEMTSKYSQQKTIQKFLLHKRQSEEKYKKNKYNNLNDYVEYVEDVISEDNVFNKT